MDFLDGGGVLADRDGERVEADRAAAELVDDGFEDALVHFVEAVVVDLDHGEGGDGGWAVDDAVGADLGVVADPAQQGVGDPRGAARAGGDVGGALGSSVDVEQAGGALDDAASSSARVVVEPVDQAEARAQRRGEHAGAGGGADQGEARAG